MPSVKHWRVEAAVILTEEPKENVWLGSLFSGLFFGFNASFLAKIALFFVLEAFIS